MSMDITDLLVGLWCLLAIVVVGVLLYFWLNMED